MFDKTTITADILKGYMESLPKKEFKGISPSSLGGCMRSHFYKIKGIEATTPPNYGTLVNFEMGRLWEEFLARAYKQQGRLVKWYIDGVDDQWWLDEYNLVGMPDIMATDNDGEIMIIDSKTVRSEWFQYTKKYKSFQDFVADNKSYIYQQVCYILLARANGFPKLRKAVLSFASKDDGYVGNEILITLTTDLVKMVTDRILEFKGYLDRNELPPCECEGWKVGYCDYGNPKTQTHNRKGKLINTSCCSDELWSQFSDNNLKTKEV